MKTFSARGRLRDAAPRGVNLEPPHILESVRASKLKFYTHLDRSSTLLKYARGRATVNLRPLLSRKLFELESLYFKHIQTRPSALFGYENFSARGVLVAQRP